MKKLLTCVFLTFIICASLLLVSCELECPHSYLTSEVIPPTCGEEGYTLNTCTSCQAEFKTNYTLPTGHDLTETVFAPTCAEEGYTYYFCKCGYNYTSDKIPPTGHSYVSVKADVTCSSAGYTEYTCTVCDHSYKGDFISATGHEMTETVYAPTKDTVGYTEYTCNTCGHSYKDDFVFYTDVVGGGFVKSSAVVAQGIDVSYFQNTPSGDTYLSLDWEALKNAGVDFAILRAGYRGYQTKAINKDPAFEINYADAKAAGMAVGAYFYTVASNQEELDEEIEALLSWLEGKQFEYPIYFDIENETLENPEQKETLTKLCMRFVDVMRENGYYGAVYTNKKWLENYLYGDVIKGYCDVWYARYPHSNDATLDSVYTWNTAEYGEQLGMWQYTEKGKLSGCGIRTGQYVDLNYSYKDYPSIIKKYGLNGFENPNIVTESDI